MNTGNRFDLCKIIVRRIENKIVILLLLVFTSLVLACHGKMKTKESTSPKLVETKELGKRLETGDSTMLNQYKDDKKDGLWRTFYQNGQIKSEGKYAVGQKEGLHKKWQEDGILSLEGFYSNGKANGLMKWFHEKGHLAGVGNMIDGIREGEWTICDVEENGNCIEAFFEKGKREGAWKIYHEDSTDKVWKEQTFKEDKMVAKKCWDENGKEIVCE